MKPKRLCLRWNAGLTCCSSTNGAVDEWPMPSGLTITGLLGVVAQAKRAGLIDAARPVLDDLIRIARFWIGLDLYAEVLTQLGEI